MERSVRSHLIAGSAREPSGPETIDVTDPASGEVIGTIPAGGRADADAAVSAARTAARDWAGRDPAERGELLKSCARTLRASVDELAEIQTRENGKPLGDSVGGVEAGIGALEQYAEIGPLHRGAALAGTRGAVDTMVPEPRGVAALIVPWNDPVAIACGQIAAALVTGNTAVFKPSERTPLSGARLVELMELPPGVLNLLLGDGRAGRALVEHPGVDIALHTGSVETGREIAAACASQLGRKALLELGGKDALVVDEDVDPRWAAEQAASGAFANAGQVCTSVERIYVHRSVAAPFIDALVAEAEAITVGDGMDPDTTMGPLIDDRQVEVVHCHVGEAAAAGALVLTGGAPPDSPGSFYPPTVLTDVDGSMRIMREETFGPVAPVQVVGSFDEALEQASATEYGLAASVLTTSQANAQRACRELQVGTVKVNSVWGGAPGGGAEPRGVSGTGFGYGPELLDELTLMKVIHMEPAPRAEGGAGDAR
ncbi:MAG: aldehyde dehydrogenase family protein [Actinomycetota bacterium]|nr:aldehyde dehydrogenase family protein [Actinomycetota bacterium]